MTLAKSKEEIIVEMMFRDAEPALRKVKGGKARLHWLNEI